MEQKKIPRSHQIVCDPSFKSVYMPAPELLDEPKGWIDLPSLNGLSRRALLG